ncbi:MAG: Rrf2 family transcriptional regulator [Melioribacteraceae bacterium]|jgi:Rrf2 family protein
MLSNKAKYGLKALIPLGKNFDKQALLISEISESENIPKKFLEQILLDLKNKGYLQSKSGRNGGYWLIRKPQEIYLGDVVRILDGPLAPVQCASLTAYAPCQDCDVETCKVRFLMKDVRDAISNILDKRTLFDMINEK